MLPLYTPAVPHQEELGEQLKCYFPDCGYDRTFDSVADLNQHVTEVHRSDGVGIKCPECSTIFSMSTDFHGPYCLSCCRSDICMRAPGLRCRF